MSGGLRHYRDWLWVFALLSILTAYILWYLQQKPHFIYSIAIAFSVAMIFCALLALRPEYRQGLIRRLLGLHKRDLERGGWFHRYGRLAGILLIINLLIFRLMLQFQLVSPQYPHFVLTFFYIQMALGMVLLVSFLRVAGKWWRYLLIIMLILTLAAIATITAILVFSP